MIKIIPAILPQSYRAIEGGVEKIHEDVHTVQIDFVDGYFAPNKTWWFNGKDNDRLQALLGEEEGLPYWEDINYEFDLMIKDPLVHIDTFVALGPSKIIFHIESFLGSSDTEKMINYFENLPSIIKETISFGIAIDISTDPNTIVPYLPYIDTIQCMGIDNDGFQGQPQDSCVIDQIKKVKSLYDNKNISVDGAVSLDNAKSLIEAGANQLIVGSAIFGNPNPSGIIRELKNICQSATTT